MRGMAVTAVAAVVVIGCGRADSESSLQSTASSRCEQANTAMMRAFSESVRLDKAGQPDEARFQAAVAARVIVNDPGCFEPTLVATAQQGLAKLQQPSPRFDP